MERCQFCLEHFRKDYSAQHEPRCAKKYWDKVCRNAELTKESRYNQSSEINRCPPVRRDTSPDADPIPATRNGLRVVHEIDIDTRLASMAFKSVFLHFWGTGDVDFCLEAIAISFRHRVPIELPRPALDVPFHNVFWLAVNVANYHVLGDEKINDLDPRGLTLMDRACLAGAASLLEPLFWRGAEFGDKSLLKAIESRSFDTVHFCLALGADPDGFAMRRGSMCAETLLMTASADPETTHIASLLVEYGAIVSVGDVWGDTPLHLAARRADVDFLRVLLAKNSSSEFLNFAGRAGERALEVAIESIDSGTAENRVLEFVSALLDAGADTIGFGYRQSALCRAVSVRCGAIVRLLLNREPECPRKTEDLNKALVQACFAGTENVFGVLIEAGATIDISEDDLRYDRLEQVKSLLKAGARVHLVEDLTLDLLFDAAYDQRLSGRKETEEEWFDAEAKYELLRLYLPDDERLRDLHSGTDVEDLGT
jgi:ankyrin repeat protein